MPCPTAAGRRTPGLIAVLAIEVRPSGELKPLAMFPKLLAKLGLATLDAASAAPGIFTLPIPGIWLKVSCAIALPTSAASPAVCAAPITLPRPKPVIPLITPFSKSPVSANVATPEPTAPANPLPMALPSAALPKALPMSGARKGKKASG